MSLSSRQQCAYTTAGLPALKSENKTEPIYNTFSSFLEPRKWREAASRAKGQLRVFFHYIHYAFSVV
jgi:hypothetical protein